MNREGPDLERLTRRLAGTPPEFLDASRIGAAGSGRVAVPALVNDLLRMHGSRAPAAALEAFDGADAHRGRDRPALTMVLVWLLADDWFIAAQPGQEVLLSLLTDLPRELEQAGTAQRFVDDAERREDMARMVLTRLDYRPAGETSAQAADRLAAVSAVERRRLLEASRAAEQRARAIREALARKAADESADKWTRE